jgi:hypothetical protein
MAESGSGRNVVALLVLLGVLVGAGAWNYQRNLQLEDAEPRPYQGYSTADLEALQAAYQKEVDAHSARYRNASSRKIRVREGGMLRDQVNEFERVQRISVGTRQIADQYAKNQVQLDAVNAEIAWRAEAGEGLQRVLRLATKYP